MYRTVFIFTLFFISIVAENNFLKFSKSEIELAKCIEDYIKYNAISIFKNSEIGKEVGKIIARDFSGKNMTTETFYEEIETKSYFSEKNTESFFDFTKSPNVQFLLKEAAIAALLDCSDDVDNNLLDPVTLPYFSNEPIVLGVILDFMLVNWTVPLNDMIRTQNGRAVLRKYANNARLLLQCTLNSTYHNYFRFLIRHIWVLRAELYFDTRDHETPYIHHRFTMDYMTPHMYGKLNRFFGRNNQYYTIRSPTIPRIYTDRILNIHRIDRPGNGRFDIYSRYQRYGMRSAEYYLESHIVQFYQILFFIEELEAVGISTDDDDKYKNALPAHLVPEDLQAIVYDDNIYRDYLLRRRNNILNRAVVNYHQNDIIENLATSSRVFEEDLVMASFNVNRLRSARVITTTSTTTTTTTTTTTASSLRESKKGGVHRNDKTGKYFSKEHKKLFDSCSGNNDNNSNAIEVKNFIDSLCYEQKHRENFCYKIHESKLQRMQIKNSNKIYGYIIYNDHYNQLLLPKNKLPQFTEILSQIFVSVR